MPYFFQLLLLCLCSATSSVPTKQKAQWCEIIWQRCHKAKAFSSCCCMSEDKTGWRKCKAGAKGFFFPLPSCVSVLNLFTNYFLNWFESTWFFKITYTVSNKKQESCVHKTSDNANCGVAYFYHNTTNIFNKFRGL